MYNNIIRKLKLNSGITGADITIAIAIFIILVPLVMLVFTNIYINTQMTKRNSEATSYATAIFEAAEKMYYDDVTIESLNNKKDSLNIPIGYEVNISVKNYNENDSTKADVVKTINITIGFKVGKQTDMVQMSKIKAKENLVTPNRPTISAGMIPVKYIIVDNITGDGYWQITSKEDPTWYNYENRNWANIMLMDGTQAEGDIQITDSNKEQLIGKRITKLGSMFVWIPRYSYKITYYNEVTKTTVRGYYTSQGYRDTNNLSTTHDNSVSLYGKVDIKFLFSTSNNYIENGKAVDASNNGYIVHPAFKDGKTNNFANGEWDKEITGIWVAKFEAGYQASTIDSSGVLQNGLDTVVYSDLKYTSNNSSYTKNAIGQDLTDANYANSKISFPVFKPLTYSYNLISIGDSYNISKHISNSFYGLSQSTDSHQIKNSEWGAVVYLAHSIYGRDGKEININNLNLGNLNGKAINAATGFSGVSATEEVANNIANVKPYYELSQGVLASTTGNITGIYDLSGGYYERVSAYAETPDGTSNRNIYGKAMVDDENKKYKTVYPYNSSSDNSGNNYIEYKNKQTISYGFGDSILETSLDAATNTNSWFLDYSNYPNRTYPFMGRSGYYGFASNAGMFYYSANNGTPTTERFQSNIK